MKYIITESQLEVIKQTLTEIYNPDQLYNRDHIINRLIARDNKGKFRHPKYIRDYVNQLEMIDCTDGNGNNHICTKIPQVIYQYLFGEY